MIQLCADWLAATLHVISKISRRVSLPANSPLAVDGDTQPAGVGVSSSDSAAGTGGHPMFASTSDLLVEAVAQLHWVYEDRPPAVVRELQTALLDRSAQFRSQGD